MRRKEKGGRFPDGAAALCLARLTFAVQIVQNNILMVAGFKVVKHFFDFAVGADQKLMR